jgi:predicted phosphodiesterase
MKLAVVSDIHGNLGALQAVLEDIAREGADQVVNLGDILSGPLQPAQTADFLMTKSFVTIRGNHERQLLAVVDGPRERVDPATSDGFAATQVGAAHVQWVRGIAAQRWLAPDLLLVHGTPASDLQYWMETVTPDVGRNGSPGVRAATLDEVRERLGPDAARASLVLCGHTHVPRIAQCGSTLVVNPGSVGLQAYDDAHPHYHRTEVGAPHARYAIVERQAKGWNAQLRAVAYDWDSASRLAAQHGRADWAYALATGRMPAPATRIAA